MQVGSPEDLDRLLSGGKVALDLIRGQKDGLLTEREFENACKGIANGVGRDLAAWLSFHRMREPPRPKAPEPKDTTEGRTP